MWVHSNDEDQLCSWNITSFFHTVDDTIFVLFSGYPRNTYYNNPSPLIPFNLSIFILEFVVSSSCKPLSSRSRRVFINDNPTFLFLKGNRFIRTLYFESLSHVKRCRYINIQLFVALVYLCQVYPAK